MSPLVSVTGRNRSWVHLSYDTDKLSPADAHDLFGDALLIPGVKWNPDRHRFSIPITVFPLFAIRQLAHRCKLPLDTFTVLPKQREPWQPERPLFPHQRKAVAQGSAMDGMLLGDEMGLCKTSTAIATARTVAEGPYLIVAPLFTRGVWRNELAAMGVDVEKEWCALAGLTANRQTFNWSATWYFCHYEIVSAWWPWIARRSVGATIIDEAHHCINSRTQRAKAADMAIGAGYRMLLTGTPMQNRPSDLWNLLTMITGPWTWGTPSQFRVRYCGAIQGEWGLKDSGPTHIDELRERMEPWFLRRLATDAGVQLPEFNRSLVMCNLSAAKKTAHDKAVASLDVEQLQAALLSGSLGKGTLKAIHTLRSTVSGGKVKATIEYAQNVLDQGESVVVFTWRKVTAWQIAQALNPPNTECVHVVTGEVPQDARELTVAEFQNNGGAIVATLDVLKEGVTLHKARTVILHDLHWVPTALLQAEKRVHRVGQAQNVSSVWMVAEDTIDTLLARVLAAKISDLSRVWGESDGGLLAQLGDFAPMATLEGKIKQSIDDWRNV